LYADTPPNKLRKSFLKSETNLVETIASLEAYIESDTPSEIPCLDGLEELVNEDKSFEGHFFGKPKIKNKIGCRILLEVLQIRLQKYRLFLGIKP